MFLMIMNELNLVILNFLYFYFVLFFLQNSAKIIRTSVLGLDENNKVRESFHFPQNNLYITSIDIQSVEPVDQRTRDALQKSVQLAIEITTNSQEAAARWVTWSPPWEKFNSIALFTHKKGKASSIVSAVQPINKRR